MDQKETVVLIFDPEYGDRIIDIARDHPVWVIGSEKNRAAVKRIRAKDFSIVSSITIWSSAVLPSTQDDWLSTIADIERHHGDFGQTPPVSVIEIIGISATQAAHTAFREFDYLEIETTSCGFRAYKKAAA